MSYINIKTQLSFHKKLLKSAKENLKSAKKAGPSNKTYINYWAKQVKQQEKKVKLLSSKK